jgi:predicted TPR repeat methyltransferase
MQRAARLHEAGDLPKAVQLYQAILEEQPRDFNALYGLGIARLQEGRLEESLDSVRAALHINATFADGWCVEGMLLARLNRAAEALACFDAALALKPDFAEGLSRRAAALAQFNRPEEALASIDHLLKLRPEAADGWNNRGGLLASLGRVEDALQSFEKALALEPDFVEAQSNRAAMLLQLKRFGEALQAADAALALQPEHAVSWNMRGNVLSALKRYEEAIASYDKALMLAPGLAAAADNRDIALFELGQMQRCSPVYIRDLFDEFSGEYDRTMLETLEYSAHLHLHTLAYRTLPPGRTDWRILDLGSGTGLVGQTFKDFARGGRLDGVDLSPRMIEAARARAVYYDLIAGDIETILHAVGRTYDLILAAETMIYFGELATILSGVAKRLESGGFFLFAVEAKTGEGWEQTEAKRFRHSEAYLRAAAARAQLSFVEMFSCVLRREGNEPVKGFAVALQQRLL